MAWTTKHAASALAATILAGILAPALAARRIVKNASPVDRVLPLIQDLKSQVETDGQNEMRSFDKFQCWCEDALGRKASDISTGKESIKSLTEQIISLNGQLGSHGAEIVSVKKDISENEATQRDATAVRTKEREAYVAEHGESESCIGALEAAITALAGAGTRGNFLETIPEAQLLSVAADVRRVLQHGAVLRSTSAKDMEIVRRFATSPESLIATGRAMSAAQVGQNPFGDYAPQSTVIQGILKGMLDSYRASVGKAMEEEASKQNAFDELMATKSAELDTLKTTLQRQETEEASKERALADSQTAKDDAAVQLGADEDFFEDTKASCKQTAVAWAERSRLRTEELAGINRAYEVLTSPEATAIFGNSSATFLQLSAARERRPRPAAPSRAYAKLRDLAGRYKSLGLAQIAAQMRTTGHFDKIIIMIDHMVEVIRKEEAQDIAHRDRCQRSQKKNGNDKEDLENLETSTQAEILRLQGQASELQGTIGQLEIEINDTNTEMQNRLQLRNQEHEDFKKALEDDTEAHALIQRAVVLLTEFYKKNRIPLSLAQTPQYTRDPDEAPDVAWKEEYGGRKAESTDIISILSMLATDLQNEIKTSRADDQKAEEEYEKDKQAMENMLRAQTESKVTAESTLAQIQEKITAKENVHTQAGIDLGNEQQMQATLEQDCGWVQTHFQDRRDKRKAELDGLAEAKAMLGGANKGDYDEAMLAAAGHSR